MENQEPFASVFKGDLKKALAVNQYIGRRPIMAFGNSDGDFQMLEWTTSDPGPSIGLPVHHTDGEREYAHDRDSHIGHLERGLDEAEKRDWVIVDMKKDWSKNFRNSGTN